MSKNILEQVLTGPEAAAEWGLAESTVRNAAAAGKFEPHEARRAGKNWLITREGMERVYGFIGKKKNNSGEEKQMKNYKVIKDGNRYTIGEWDKGYNAFIVNDGIYGYYWWDSLEAAEEAANAYNEYDGVEWLGQHGYGNDVINKDEIDDMDSEVVELYKLFNAIDD